MIKYSPDFQPQANPWCLRPWGVSDFPCQKTNKSFRIHQGCLFTFITSLLPQLVVFYHKAVLSLTLKERVLEAFLSPGELKPSFGLCQILYPCQRLHLSQTLKCNYYDLSLFGVNKISPGIFSPEVCSWEKSSPQPGLCSVACAALHVQQSMCSLCCMCSANCSA